LEFESAGSFKYPKVRTVAMHVSKDDRQIYVASGLKIDILSVKGAVRKSLTFSGEMEGAPRLLDTHGGYLAACTDKNVLRIWNLARAEPKPMGVPRRFEESAGGSSVPLGHVRSVRVNCSGTRLSLLVDQGVTAEGDVRIADPRLFIYDAESDRFLRYSVGHQWAPVSHMWDATDPRFMACEMAPQRSLDDDSDGLADSQVGETVTLSADDANADSPPPLTGPHLLTLFVTPDGRIVRQDCVACQEDESGDVCLMPVALAAPFVYLLPMTGAGGSDTDTTRILRRTLRDLAGLEHVDAKTAKALMDFSYHLAAGNTDEAYRSVQGVESRTVWLSMAKMCVKTQRLDVAAKCLAELGHATAAAALRECEEPEVDARLAVVALHLGLVDEASRLYEQCGRYDLLNQLHQTCAQFDKALQVASDKDRIHLRSTHYAAAQYHESTGQTQDAISDYEAAQVHAWEVPRMLQAAGKVEELTAYVDQAEDKRLYKWLASYYESCGDLDGSMRYYRKADDWVALVRLHCLNQNVKSAVQICNDTNDAAACYHLAKHLELEGRPKDAIHWYSKTGRVRQAIRVAQDAGLESDLMGMALSSTTTEMSAAARYYLLRGQASKAVVLYSKAGQVRKAVDICLEHHLVDGLRRIADELSKEADPQLLTRCAEFLIANEQPDKAVGLLSATKQYERAIELCEAHDVPLSEDLVEKMTPDKNQLSADVRSDLLGRLGKVCKRQGLFQLACKKFTQAGDKVKAMKSLLKAGDTQKIVFFAGTARQAEVYILAANYLQGLEWQSDPEVTRNIISFYTKAKAFDKLSQFYDSCSQVEVDEYRDYDKAAGLLKEALKAFLRSLGIDKDTHMPPGIEHDTRVVALQRRIQLVDKFASARRMMKSDPQEMIKVCRALLGQTDLETAIRAGDVYAQLIEYYASVRKFDDAFELIEKMRGAKIALGPYVDRSLLEDVYRGVGQPLADLPEADEGIDEDIHPQQEHGGDDYDDADEDD